MKQKKLQQQQLQKEEKKEQNFVPKKKRRKNNYCDGENFLGSHNSPARVPFIYAKRKICKEETQKNSKNHKINLSNYPNLNNPHLEELGKENPNVKYLDLRQSFNLNTESFRIIHEKWGKNLVSINVEYSHVMTDFHLFVLFTGGSPSLTPGGTLSIAPCALPLRKLNLSHTPITDRGIYYLVKSCRNLKRISLNATNITNLSLSLIAQYCPHIIHLDIAECCRITDFGVQIVAQQFSVNLKVLDLSFCKLVTDAIFGYLCFYCPNLKVLRVRCTQVTPEGLLRLLPRVVLSELNVQGLALLDDHLSQIGSQKSLQILDVSFCHGITSAGISAVVHECLALEEVHLFGLNFLECDLDSLRKNFRVQIFC